MTVIFLTGADSTATQFMFDYDVFLVRGAIRTVDFDEAIAEFGSGTSTRLWVDGTVLCAGYDAIALQSINKPDRVVVGTEGQVHSFGGAGIRMDGPNARLINDGQVSGDTGAVIANGSSSLVENRGTMSGHAVGGAGIRMDGQYARLINDGQVSGDTGAVIANGISSVVENRGTLSGHAVDGVGLRCENGESFVQVSNSGIISGAVGLSVAGCYVHVQNSGSIRATDGAAYAIDLTLAFAGCVVRNAGLIEAPNAAFRGGAGDDIIGNSGRITGDVLCSGGNDIFRGAGGVLDGALFGGDGNDTLASGQADDILSGESGNDILAGGGGDDLIYGGAGNDLLRGDAGDDTLRGGNGADTLRGGAGDDFLYGGAGADVFVFRRGDGDDRIADFENGTDRIDLRDFALASFAALSAVAANRPAGLLIDLDTFGGDTIIVAGLTKAQFDAGDVIL
jgi:Ca2+-binding RTX toxin-like protein